MSGGRKLLVLAAALMALVACSGRKVSVPPTPVSACINLGSWRSTLAEALARTDDANNAFRLGDTASEQRSTALAASAWDKLAQMGDADTQTAEAVTKLRDLYLAATTDPGSAAPPAHAEAMMQRFETYVSFLEENSEGLNFCR
jgi:hypothetical protein